MINGLGLQTNLQQKVVAKTFIRICFFTVAARDLCESIYFQPPKKTSWIDSEIFVSPVTPPPPGFHLKRVCFHLRFTGHPKHMDPVERTFQLHRFIQPSTATLDGRRSWMVFFFRHGQLFNSHEQFSHLQKQEGCEIGIRILMISIMELFLAVKEKQSPILHTFQTSHRRIVFGL